MIERNVPPPWTRLELRLREAGAGKESDTAKLHFEARTPHALAALEAVLPGARFPLHTQLATLLHERWCRRAEEWGRLGHPQLSGKGEVDKLLKSTTCPGGHLGIATRGIPCNARGCPICAGRTAALAYERVGRCVERQQRFGTPVELAMVPAATADVPGDAGGRARLWFGTMYGPGKHKLVAMPAGTNWQSLPWGQLVDQDGWYWRSHYLVNLRDRAAIARAVGRVFPYDVKLLTDPADTTYRRLHDDWRPRQTNATGVLRCRDEVKSLTQCDRDPWTRRRPFVSPQPGVAGGRELLLVTSEASRIEAARKRGDASATSARSDLDQRVEDIIHDWLRSKRIDATVQCGAYTPVEWLVGVANVCLRPGLRRDLVKRCGPGTNAMIIVTRAGYLALFPRPEAPGDYLVEPLQSWARRRAENAPPTAEAWARPVAMPKRFPRGPEDSGPGTKRPRIGADYYRERQSTLNMAPCMRPYLSEYRGPDAPSDDDQFWGRMATIEDKAVRLLLSLSGRPMSVKDFRQIARDKTDSPNLTLSLWEEALGPLPFRMNVDDGRFLFGLRMQSNGRAPARLVELLEDYVEAGHVNDDRPVAVLVKCGPVRLVVHDGRAPQGAGGALVMYGPRDEPVWLEYPETYFGRFIRAGQIEVGPRFAA